MDDFPEFVKTEIAKRGWSQSKLARKARLDYSTVNKLVRRVNPRSRPRTKEAILRAFGTMADNGKALARASPDEIQNVLLRCRDLTEKDVFELMATIETKIKLNKQGEKRATVRGST